ncbi:(Fe-S)-binding protein [Acidiplasma sp.]|uniref:(Fe-S)-binding protein n=1 Tax=Acidiplasma sp. TaxID=1872114 RepID=UPI0025877F32|nr:(Fe-S)-binding protein [Acidiplasma sp.]
MTKNQILKITDECIKCGFCESVCPTLPAAGYNSIKGARGRIILAQFAINTGEELQISDSFYSCLDCFACLQVCPAGVNAGELSHLMKEEIAEKHINGNRVDIADMIKETILRFRNPLGLNKESAEWASSINFDESDTILFTGDMYQLMAYTKFINYVRKYFDRNLFNAFSRLISRHPDLIKLSRHFYDINMKNKMENNLRNIVRLLKMSGVKFNYLREDEDYPGMFLYDLGYINEFKKYANNVYNKLKKLNVKKIICIDPHTYDLMKNIYPEYIKNYDLEIYYYTDLINMNFEKTSEEITVQQPCHIVLHKNNYRALDILKKSANVKLNEPENLTSCCGGPDELLFPEIASEVSYKRYNNLKQTAGKIITICPLCYNNLSYDENVIDFSDFMIKLIK